MSPPAELSFDEILKFMLAHNGKVTNHELVKHFKVFLMNPDMRDEARSTFKKHVNSLAIIKNQNNEKWLILKKKYIVPSEKDNDEQTEIKNPEVPTESEPSLETPTQPPQRPPPPLQLNQDFNILNSIIPDHTPITSPVTPVELEQSVNKESLDTEDIPPKVHPRRRSSEKNVLEKSLPSYSLSPRSSIPNSTTELSESPLTTSRSESMLVENEQKISVKERKQMFNRMASESDVLKSHKLSFNSSSVDEEDRASLEHKENDPLDPKQKQWILCAARGEYHTLAKMCKENAKLVRTKDPFTGTAMHWACKRGDENLVKLLAGIHRHIVNERSNGGYTPLHIAMQFRHEHVYRLLVEVYDADADTRDWSGRKPRAYLARRDTALSPGAYRKKEGFLRIGSLNVRVKKTTEAFSNFLGVGATRTASGAPGRRATDGDALHSWGSADDIQKGEKLMPPPSGKVRRRGASGRSATAAHAHSRSTPSTPDQPRAQLGTHSADSDSDSAAGFHSAWRQQRASHS
ncbi:ankyrin repeat domain-containing protein SOWAHB isoform X2 [Pararge aegeria]|uniref:ankyrin repeat domain-containing protein SOWAHB isoform X2 n=1 Tax=Pararge aegeria TaxID=116150 RepID=UPI0019CFCCCC|nr:ankyrin repeat domain-containing protein SOWAHB isoform X2 [Pararge aegeria]